MKPNNDSNQTIDSVLACSSSLTQATVRGQLTNEHRQELVDKSAITSEIALLGCESFKSARDVGLNYDLPGILFKSVNPTTGTLNKSVFCARLDFNKAVKKEKETPKYPSPKGYQPDVFFCPMLDPDFWLKKIIDKKQSIFLAEGWKKAASLLSQNYPAIAAPSISTFFQSSNQKNPGEPLEGLIPFFDKERIFYIVPDADYQINENVALNLSNNLDKLVKGRSKNPFKEIRILVWEYTPNIKGIDDLLAATGEKERKELIANLMRESLTIEQFRGYLQTIKFDNSYNDANESLEDAVLRIINKQYPNTYYRTATDWFVKTDGRQLEVADDDDVKEMIASILSDLVKVDCKGNRRRGLSTEKNIKACLGRFSTSCKTKTSLQQNPNLLYFENGIFDTNTDTFRNYEKTDVSRINLPYAYQADATCPDDINSFWQEKYGDPRLKTAEEQLDLLQALIRFYLDFPTDQGWNWFIHLTGGSDTGKGVFCKMIDALYASENVTSIIDVSQLSSITDSYNYINEGTRVCIGDEIDAYIKNIGGLYGLVTGAKVPTRKLHQNADPKAKPLAVKILLASTAALGASMTSNDGLGRRLIVLKTSGHKGEPTVGHIDFRSLAGQYASWALQMPRTKVKETLMKLQRLNADETALTSNPINRFLTQCFLRVNNADRQHSTNDAVTEELMFQYYTAWCAYEGTAAIGRGRFVDRLKESIGMLYRDNKDRITINGKQIRPKNRYIGLKPAFKLDRDTLPLRLTNPDDLIEGQTLNDLTQTIDTREPIRYEEPQISYEVKTTPPSRAIPEDLAF